MNNADFDGAYRKPVYFRSPFLEFKDTILNEVGLDLANPMTSPRVIKTHLPVHLMPKQVKEKNCKVIKWKVIQWIEHRIMLFCLTRIWFKSEHMIKTTPNGRGTRT